MNPVRAGMVPTPGEYKWSSFWSNGLGRPAKLWTPHAVYRGLGKSLDEFAKAYREIFQGHIDMELLTQIRKSTNKGLALGNDKFKQEIERLTGRRVYSLKSGPKPKSEKDSRELLL